MGPIALFDKSFLEGLNVDEAVLFDHFFYAVTCPIFYVETLADLEKVENKGRRPEDIVGSIAFKSPQMHGGPNVYHRTLVVGNLLGQDIPMIGQIVMAGGIPVRVDGKNNVVFKPSPEAEAFNRWQRGQFEEIEREYAKVWREELRTLDLKDVAKQTHHYGLDLGACKTIEQAKAYAEQVINGLSNSNQIALALDKFRINHPERTTILENWTASGSTALSTYAPYAYFVLLIEIFFEISLATGKISADRPSNINDLAYLFYLPFSMVFLSSDKLHRSCAPLFLRPDQQFLWGPDVKADLKANHDALMTLPEDKRLRGLISLNPAPLAGGLIGEVHARYLRPRSQARTIPTPNTREPSELAEQINRITRAAKSSSGEVNFAPKDADSITIERLLHKKRGSWFQVPHDTEPTDE